MAYTVIENNVFDKISKLSGKTLYVYLLLRSKLRYRTNSSKLVSHVVELPYAEAEKNGLSHMAFCRGLKQLLKVGLIEIVQKGYFGGRKPSRYKVF